MNTKRFLSTCMLILGILGIIAGLAYVVAITTELVSRWV